MRFPIIFFLVLLLIITQTSAMGLRGVSLKDEFFFEPGLEKTYEYAFSTNAGTTQDYELYVRMLDRSTIDLTSAVTLSTHYVEDVPTGNIVPFTAYLKLPETIDIPGIHEIRVGARETQNIGGGMMGVRTAAEARIIIIKLHPQPYAETTFTPANANMNEVMPFTFTLRNLGEPDLKVKGRVDIRDPETDLILGVANTDEITIAATEKKELFASFNNTGLRAGTYPVHATLRWGPNSTEWNGTINIGARSVTIKDHTKEFVKDALNRMQITLKSGWNNPMKNIYSEVLVFIPPETTTPHNSFKTVSSDIPAWGETTLEGYLNTTGLEFGDYPIRIITRFEDYSSVYDSTISITEDARTPLYEEKPEEKKESTIPSYVIILLIIVSLLFIIFITLLIIIMRRR